MYLNIYYMYLSIYYMYLSIYYMYLSIYYVFKYIFLYTQPPSANQRTDIGVLKYSSQNPTGLKYCLKISRFLMLIDQSRAASLGSWRAGANGTSRRPSVSLRQSQWEIDAGVRSRSAITEPLAPVNI